MEKKSIAAIREELNNTPPEQLQAQIDALHREASVRDEQYATEIENAAAQKRSLEAAKMKAEEEGSAEAVYAGVSGWG